MTLPFNCFYFEGLYVSAQECQALGYAANFQLNFKVLIPAWILNGSAWAESENPEKTDDVQEPFEKLAFLKNSIIVSIRQLHLN